MDGSEFLQTSHLSEAEHSAFSSSKRQVDVCSDAQACGRVAEIAGMVNQRGTKGGTNSINNN